MEVLKGRVLWYCSRDKNGIVVDSKGLEYYFDISVIKDRDDKDFQRKKNVSFVLNDKVKDCRCAKNIILID
jgi:hypothetical protein